MNPREDSTGADGSDTNAKSAVEAFKQVSADVPEGTMDHHLQNVSAGQASMLDEAIEGLNIQQTDYGIRFMILQCTV